MKHNAKTGTTGSSGGRKALRCRNRAQSSAFFPLKAVRPKDDWDTAAVGIAIASGNPEMRQGRQASHGIVMYMDRESASLTFNKLRRITGLDITEENYRSFISAEAWAKFEQLAQHSPIPVSAQDCLRPDPDRVLDYFYVRTMRAFGADVALFGRYADGYHAFYIANSSSSCWLPDEAGPVPSLEDIDAMYDRYDDWNVYDRLLTADEANWFQNAFFGAPDDPEDTWNDMYGRTHTDYEYMVNGQKFAFRRNTCFSREMHRHIIKLAEGGIEIQ